MTEGYTQLVVEPARRACEQVVKMAQHPALARGRQMAQDPDFDGQSRYLINEALSRHSAAVAEAQNVLSKPGIPHGFNRAALLQRAGGALQDVERYIGQAEQLRREDRSLGIR